MWDDRHDSRGGIYSDRFRIAERLEKEGGPRPGELLNDAAFRVAKLMKAEEEARQLAPAPEQKPEAPSATAPSRDYELAEVNITVKLPRRDVRELFAKAA